MWQAAVIILINPIKPTVIPILIIIVPTVRRVNRQSPLGKEILRTGLKLPPPLTPPREILMMR
jgi:hypothetical protein